MYPQLFQQMSKMLGQLDAWLVRAEQHAKTKGFEPSLFLQFRLAPDQFPFVRQVQIACDTAKLSAARLTGKEAPSHPDTETSLEELRARIAKVRDYLKGFRPEDFAKSGSQVVSQPRWEGQVMDGEAYFVEHALPNFFFHVTHAYALLRHNGVDVGKRDYLGELSLHAPGTKPRA